MRWGKSGGQFAHNKKEEKECDCHWKSRRYDLLLYVT